MSKYDGLRDLLRGQTQELRYSFTDLAAVVPGGLPPSAYRHEAWWSNHDHTHVQCRAWGDAGFTAHPDLVRQVVEFRPDQSSSPKSGRS